MYSDDLVRSVARKLKYYAEVKRLEDGFDLSGVNSTPQYPLKLRMVPIKSNEKEIKKCIKQYMASPHYMLSYLPDCYKLVPSKLKQSSLHSASYGGPFKAWKQKTMSTGWVPTKSLSSHHISPGETERIVNVASKLLVATDMLQNIQPCPPSTAPRLSQRSGKLPSMEHQRGTKFKLKKKEISIYDIYGQKTPRFKNLTYKNNSQKQHDTDSQRHQVKYQKRRLSSDRSADTSSTNVALDETSGEKQPSVRNLGLEKKISLVKESAQLPVHVADCAPLSEEEIVAGSKIHMVESVGIQTEKKLLTSYDYHEDEVKDGLWAEYRVVVRTGDKLGASTQADVKLTMYGENGRTKEFLLAESMKNKLKFQKGKEDQFTVYAHHVGRLDKVKIGHDRVEMNYGWFLDSVTVYDLHKERVYEFPCGQWLCGQDGGDRQTYRELWRDRDRALLSEPDNHTEGSQTTSKDDLQTQWSSEKNLGQNESIEKISVEAVLSITSKTGDVVETSTTAESAVMLGNDGTKLEQRERAAADKTTIDEDVQKASKVDCQFQEPKEIYTSVMKEIVAVGDSSKDFDSLAPVQSLDEKLTKTPHHCEPTIISEQSGTNAEHSELEAGVTKCVSMGSQPSLTNGDSRELLETRVPGCQWSGAANLIRPVKGQGITAGGFKTDDEHVDAKEMGGGNEYISNSSESSSEDEDDSSTADYTDVEVNKIYAAVQSGKIEQVKELLEQYPDLHGLSDEKGWTLLHTAAANGHSNIIEHLVTRIGVEIDAPALDNHTAVHLAAEFGHVTCLKVLVDLGATINCWNVNREMPLHLAAKQGHLECVEWLATHQSSCSVVNMAGYSPRDLASQFLHADVAQFLEDFQGKTGLI